MREEGRGRGRTHNKRTRPADSPIISFGQPRLMKPCRHQNILIELSYIKPGQRRDQRTCRYRKATQMIITSYRGRLGMRLHRVRVQQTVQNGSTKKSEEK